MKKFLSLVLALVMTMSLVTVSAGAVDFTDDSSIKYEEAVDVISAAGVVGGYADGSFNPNGTLTRGAAAKILCNLMLGTKTAATLKAAEAPFSDVPVDNVFAAYIAYCANEGIISGYADGTFKPAATLTGFAFMKMLLGAIGYDQTIERFTGTNWAINVAKLGVAKDLNKGIKGFDGTKYITREEAAHMAFKAMQATLVEYENKSSVTIGDIVISNNSQAKDVETGDTTLMEKNFGKLDSSDAVDAYGRPATEWTFDGELVGKYGDSADYTIVASKDKTIAELIEKEKLDKVITDCTIGGDVDVVIGEVVELFVDDKAIENYVVYSYGVAQIDEVEKADEDIDEDAIADGAKYIVTFEDGTEVYDIQLKGFNAKTYVDGAWVMFPVIDDEFVTEEVEFEESGDLDVYVDTVIASSVSGKVTATTADYVKVDGKKYVVSNEDVVLAAGDEGTFFVDPNGYVIGFSEKEDDDTKVGDVLLVVGTWDDEVTTRGETVTTTMFTVIDTKGNVQDIAVAKSNYNDGEALKDMPEEGDIITIKAGKKDLSKVTVIDEEINDDYSIATGVDFSEIESDDKKVDEYRLNKDTTYIVFDAEDLSDVDVTVKVGGVTVKENGDDATVIYKNVNDNKIAAYVFMTAELKGSVSDEVLFISAEAVEDAENVLVGDDDIACLSIEAVTLEGKTKTILVAEDDADILGENGFFTVDEIDDDSIYTLVAVEDAYEDGETTGVAEGDFVRYYETEITFGDFEDVETEDAAFADIHDTDDYAKTVKSLSAMKTAADKGYTVSLMVYADEDDGAKLIVVTSVVK